MDFEGLRRSDRDFKEARKIAKVARIFCRDLVEVGRSFGLEGLPTDIFWSWIDFRSERDFERDFEVG